MMYDMCGGMCVWCVLCMDGVDGAWCGGIDVVVYKSACIYCVCDFVCGVVCGLV